MKAHHISRLAVLCLALGTAISSCSKKDLLDNGTSGSLSTAPISADPLAMAAATTTTTTNTMVAESVATSATSLPAFTLPYTLSVNWNNRTNGDYTQPQVASDFGPTAYWQGTTAQSQVSNGTFRATLLKNMLSSGGVQSKIDIPDATMYRLNFDMMFAPDFDFSEGGKSGFGLLIGDGNSDGTPGTNGNGGSFRLTWGKSGSAVVLRPNVYHKDQANTWGDDFGKVFPAGGASIQKGVWYKVSMSVISNSGSLNNGTVQLTINGSTVLNQSIRWTSNDAKRFVSNICLDAYRTGNTTAYQSATDGNIFFDNVVVKSLSTVGPVVTAAPAPAPTVAPSGLFSRTVNWDGRANGAYGLSQAVSDFGNTPYWQQTASTQSQVYNGALRTTLLANSLTPGGVLSRSAITPGSQYELSYDMKFDNNFDFSWGGKVGYGLFIGEGNTGGDPGWDGNGGSVRLMWYKNTSTSPVILKPYVYYKDQPGTYGDDFGKTFPANGSSIQTGVWYNVKMVVKSNTGSNTDGRVQVLINGTTVLDQAIRWTTNDLQRLVNSLCFENFRGGAETYWQSATNGDIYFDNVKLTQLAL